MAPKRPKHMWHHSRVMETIEFGPVVQVRAEDMNPMSCDETCKGPGWPKDDSYHWDLYMDAAYEWIRDRAGFWPLFIAVGDDKTAVSMSGYFSQWQRSIGYSKETGNIYRKAGEFPNRVLFSFDQKPEDIRYLDYDYYHCILNSINYGYDEKQKRCLLKSEVKPHEEKWVTKPQWDEDRWIKAALSYSKNATGVQGVVPRLDLRLATRIWCRSQKAKQELVTKGFDPEIIHVVRVKLNEIYGED